MFQWQPMQGEGYQVQGAVQHQPNISGMQWPTGGPQVLGSMRVQLFSSFSFSQVKMNASHGGSQMFGGAPYTSYQGHFLVPVKPELCQLPINQMRAQFMQFIHLGSVNFDTQVYHTGTGEIHKLGFYFNEHIVSIVILNAMFNNSSSGDKAQFDQVSFIFESEIRYF